MHYELINSYLVPGRKSALGLGQNSTFKIQNYHSLLCSVFRSLERNVLYFKSIKGNEPIQNSTFKITFVPLFFCLKTPVHWYLVVKCTLVPGQHSKSKIQHSKLLLFLCSFV